MALLGTSMEASGKLAMKMCVKWLLTFLVGMSQSSDCTHSYIPRRSDHRDMQNHQEDTKKRTNTHKVTKNRHKTKKNDTEWPQETKQWSKWPQKSPKQQQIDAMFVVSFSVDVCLYVWGLLLYVSETRVFFSPLQFGWSMKWIAVLIGLHKSLCVLYIGLNAT